MPKSKKHMTIGKTTKIMVVGLLSASSVAAQADVTCGVMPAMTFGTTLSGAIGFLSAATAVILFLICRRQQRHNFSLRLILNNVSDAIIRTGTDNRIGFINAAAEKITGWSGSEAIGKSLSEVLNNRQRQLCETVTAGPEGGMDIRRTYRNALPHILKSKDGTSYKVTMHVFPILTGGRQDGSLAVIRDVTDDSLRYDRLLETQKHFQSMFDNAPLLIAMTTLKGKIIFANKLYADKIGHSQFELSQMPILELVHPADTLRFKREYDAIINRTSELSHFKVRMMTNQDVIVYTEITCLPLCRPNGRIKHILCMARDITNEADKEQVIAREREQRRLIVENTSELILQLDRNYQIASSNRDDLTVPAAAADGFKCARIICHGDYPCQDCPIRDSLENGRAAKKEMHVKDTFLMVSSSPLYNSRREVDGAMVIVLDITEQRKLEFQLLHAQKMDAIGKLAGGIAHDFNNLLQVILGYGDLLKKHIGDEDGVEMWQQVVEAGNSAKSLVRQLLTFSRKDTVTDMKINDLNGILLHFQKMLARIIGENIDFKLELCPHELLIASDVGLLEQVMMNLCINAKDAMPNGGSLKIVTTLITDPGNCPDIPGKFKDAGQVVCCEIVDTGHGISPEIVNRIFEPFFTTKAIDKGTGLGLAMVYSIVNKHDGMISVESEVDRGTKFRILFPYRNHDDGNESGNDLTARSGEEKKEMDNQLVLHVEDDENVRKITKVILESEGYSVVNAASGTEGIDLFDANRHRLNAVLLDVVLPGISSREVASHVRQVAPELPILFCSGYSLDAVGLNENEIFIPKPFTGNDLAKTFRTVMKHGHFRETR